VLASRADVAQALGLDDENGLSESQANRVDALLERVSRLFAREAGRSFTPGLVTVRAAVVAGRVRLPDSSDGGTVAVEDLDGVALTAELDGLYVDVARNGCALATGELVTVTYTRGETPESVTAAVAGIVARNLTVDPMSAEAQSTDISTLDFRQRLADWVSSTNLLTDEEIAEARSYRYPAPNVIVHRL